MAEKKTKKKAKKVKAVKKKTTKKKPKEKKVKKGPGKYFRGIGRRKTAVARVRLFTRGEKEILVNSKPLKEYFSDKLRQETAKTPLSLLDVSNKFRVTAVLRGGGKNAQAEALRHGISRALVVFDPDLRKQLKKAGYLTRDPRMRERKKFGLKRARRAPQWQKR
jgi:small subunit ribosomal protein S9